MTNSQSFGHLSLNSLLQSTRISSVWSLLGGPKLRGGPVKFRGPAWWRRGDGLNVGVDDLKGVWRDHVADDGGGVLDLIQRCKGLTHSQGAHWLAGQVGVELDGGTALTPRQRREYALEARHAADASVWFLERLAFLETLKARAIETTDDGLLERSAREHYQLTLLRGQTAEITRRYLKARSTDRVGTARMLRSGSAWKTFSEKLLLRVVAQWSAEEPS
jgi:hypothetical protein